MEVAALLGLPGIGRCVTEGFVFLKRLFSGMDILQVLAGSELDPFSLFDLDLFFSADIPSESRFFRDDLEAGKSTDFNFLVFGKSFFQ